MERGRPTIRDIVKVMARTIAALAFAVASAGSPLAVLYCEDSGPAAMACCQGDASECNQPGKTADCCRVVPTAQDGAVTLAKAPETPSKFHAVFLSLEPAPVLWLADLRPTVGAAPLRPADLSPPRSPILRI